MPTHYTIEPGDCLASVAVAHGWFPDALWNHRANASLRKLRSDGYVLLPGDVIVIPECRPKIAAAATGHRHTFRRRGVPTRLRLRLLDDGKPRAETPYTLAVQGRTFRGQTDADGNVVAWISPEAGRAVLTIETVTQVESYELLLGHLDPMDTDDGPAQRLCSLGYLRHAQRIEHDRFASAVQSFQVDAGLPPSGELDDATTSALTTAHGR